MHDASDTSWLDEVAAAIGASAVTRGERLQALWSGYGEIVRVAVSGGPVASVVVKRVAPPAAPEHPRGWSNVRSHARKLRSYEIEAVFYQRMASRCDDGCRVAHAHLVRRWSSGWLLVLEDLEAAGFGRRRIDRAGDVGEQDVTAVVEWLSRFHARFLHAPPDGLWPTGTYWHLATRPDELEAMHDQRLAAAAIAIDERLRRTPFRTLVHGDAKLANFCFGERAVAAVDFQYVGGGVGVVDLAYFLGSVFDSVTLERRADGWLDRYFERLRLHLHTLHPALDTRALEFAWRAAWPFAWADFERFLDGWAPGHPKRNAYTAAQVDFALRALGW